MPLLWLGCILLVVVMVVAIIMTVLAGVFALTRTVTLAVSRR
jgi:hypothetical protein